MSFACLYSRQLQPKCLAAWELFCFFPMRRARMFTIRETSQSTKIYAYIGSMTKILQHHPVYAFINPKVWSDYDNRACTFSHSSRVNVYWSIETWACKFWFVCARCLWGRCREESITIGMWSWLLERLWKSHRAMIKSSVRASLEPHHSRCLYKRHRVLANQYGVWSAMSTEYLWENRAARQELKQHENTGFHCCQTCSC